MMPNRSGTIQSLSGGPRPRELPRMRAACARGVLVDWARTATGEETHAMTDIGETEGRFPAPPERIETARLLLRRATVGDAESIFREYAQDAEVTRYLCWRPHTDAAQTRAFMEQCRQAWDTGAAYPFAIIDRADGRLMGMIEMRLDGHRAEFGYVLARPHWGRGCMPEALDALIRRASALAGIRRIWAYCDVENRASQRVLEKAGMEREGLVRRWARMPNLGDAPRDCFFYSLPDAVDRPGSA